MDKAAAWNQEAVIGEKQAQHGQHGPLEDDFLLYNTVLSWCCSLCFLLSFSHSSYTLNAALVSGILREPPPFPTPTSSDFLRWSN